jgi:hypothetical protein
MNTREQYAQFILPVVAQGVERELGVTAEAFETALTRSA